MPRFDGMARTPTVAENSGISWTTHTFNPWWGCVEVSAECDNCYARTWAKYTRSAKTLWGRVGDRAERDLATDSYWRWLPKWQKAAKAAGERHRVFVASMSDILEDAMIEADALGATRQRLWEAIPQCPDLDFLLLTKRPQNYLKMVPFEWTERWDSWPGNVWAGTTVGLQSSAWRLDHLARVPAWVKWVSCEPLLGPLDLRPWLRHCPGCGSPMRSRSALSVDRGVAEPILGCLYCSKYPEVRGLAWIIVGGESGGPPERALVESCPELCRPKPGTILRSACRRCQDTRWAPKPEAEDWVLALMDQAREADVDFHFKQWGGPRPKSGGRIVRGHVWDEIPGVRT